MLFDKVLELFLLWELFELDFIVLKPSALISPVHAIV
jgi:hypothetical protein